MPENKTIFETLHHVCIVVEDIDDAMRYFENLGVCDWQDYPPLSDYVEVSLERSEFESLTYKLCNLGNIQLQLCQPGPGNTAQRRFLEDRGPGVYHLGFDVPDVAEAERIGQDAGLAPGVRGRRADGSGFTYFQTGAALGVTLEVRASPGTSLGT
ncbi:MAG: glyoxalase [Marmoricola sp.]|jgi:methylmalonyl-CoA/ethylmalonyl-CoA epimerase|nr:glyoxalase [Marmoricola sp.]